MPITLRKMTDLLKMGLGIEQEGRGGHNGLLMECNIGCSLSLELETSITIFLSWRKSRYLYFKLLILYV